MNQLATLGNMQLPDHIRDTSGQAAGLVTSESVPRITLKDASFRLKKDGNEINVGLAKPIQVVILGIDPPEPKRTAKVWYDAAWNADSAEAPDCFSNDGITPDPSVADPQCGTCAQCPKNAWGSGHDAEGNASKGKACSDRKNLLVVLGGKHIDGDVFRLSIPPTSLKALSTYGRELVRYNVNMHRIVTQIDVDPENSKGMLFNYAGFLAEAEANRMDARAASPELSEMTHTAALPAPAAASPTGMSLDNPAMAGGMATEIDLDALGTTAAPAPAVQEIVSRGKAEAPPATMQDITKPDSKGHTWDDRIHSSAQTQNADGSWKLKRGVPKELVASVLAAQSAQTETQGGGDVEIDVPEVDDLDDLLDKWGAGV